MAETEDINPDESSPKKPSKMPLIIGLVLALVGGAGGFWATQNGPLASNDTPVQEAESETNITDMMVEDVTFIALDPITITLPPGSDRRLLRLSAQLDVIPSYAEDVEKVKPRIADVLNTYLRAVRISDLEAPNALIRLRIQMLHRVQVVTGADIVRDLLITEFVMN